MTLHKTWEEQINAQHDDWPKRKRPEPPAPAPPMQRLRIFAGGLPGGQIDLDAAKTLIQSDGRLVLTDSAGRAIAVFASGQWQLWQLLEDAGNGETTTG